MIQIYSGRNIVDTLFFDIIESFSKNPLKKLCDTCWQKRNHTKQCYLNEVIDQYLPSRI